MNKIMKTHVELQIFQDIHWWVYRERHRQEDRRWRVVEWSQLETTWYLTVNQSQLIRYITLYQYSTTNNEYLTSHQQTYNQYMTDRHNAALIFLHWYNNSFIIQCQAMLKNKWMNTGVSVSLRAVNCGALNQIYCIVLNGYFKQCWMNE